MSKPITDDLVVIGSFASRIEAEVAHGALLAADIESVISADDVGGQYANVWTEGVRLLVRPADLVEAKKLLSSE